MQKCLILKSMIKMPYKTEEKHKSDIIQKTTAAFDECLQKLGYIPYKYKSCTIDMNESAFKGKQIK